MTITTIYVVVLCRTEEEGPFAELGCGDLPSAAAARAWWFEQPSEWRAIVQAGCQQYGARVVIWEHECRERILLLHDA